MHHFFLALFLLTTVTSCHSRYDACYVPCCEEERTKPVIALITVRDTANSGLNWNLGREISEEIYQQILEDNTVNLLPEDVEFAHSDKIGAVDYFGTNLSFTQHFRTANFIILMELVQHQVTPHQFGKNMPIKIWANDFVLAMQLRIRILDTRFDRPHIILQETIKKNLILSRDWDKKHNFTTKPWGSKEYRKTQLAKRHQQLAYDAAKRIEQAVLMAQQSIY